VEETGNFFSGTGGAGGAGSPNSISGCAVTYAGGGGGGAGRLTVEPAWRNRRSRWWRSRRNKLELMEDSRNS
jgi:hypothetical protein